MTESPEPAVLGDTLVPYALALARRPELPAFTRIGTYRRDRWTRGQVLAAAHTVARRLAESGIGPGDRVLLQGQSSPAWVAVFLGCMLRGAVVVPLDPGLPKEMAATLGRRVDVRAGFGDALEPPNPNLPWQPLAEVSPGSPAGTAAGSAVATAIPPTLKPGDLLEIVFTSGTTGMPRAVPITHANVLANIHRIEIGFQRWRRLVHLIGPRLLCLVPGSHLFGQVGGMFLPLLMEIPVVFLDDLRPRAIREAIRTERIWVGLAVPRMLRLVQDDLTREGLAAAAPEPAAPGAAAPPRSALSFALSWLRRSWRSRRARSRLGWRFLAWVSGGARLEEEIEAFWEALGVIVVQGYGLTETAPVISVNNPFSGRRGSVGRPLAGQEIRIGPGGELWVRGPNVAAGYLDDEEATAEVFHDGWLRTGDIVEPDEQGRLYVRGRLKDVIVAADGTNIDPGEIEQALEAQADVREAACIAVPGARGEEIHAVLIMNSPGVDPAAAVRAANERLLTGRRVQSFTLWNEPTLPRTHTGKLKRAAVREEILRRREAVAQVAGGGLPPAGGKRAAGGGSEAGTAAADPVRAALAEMTGRAADALGDGTDLDRDLGLSSLDRLDLMVRLEQVTGRTLDETTLATARSVSELRQALERPPAPPLPMPRWARRLPARSLREITWPFLISIPFRLLFRLRIEGRERLRGLQPPFLIVANHESQLDTPCALLGLPRRLRRRVAVAMAADQFPAFFEPEGHSRLATWRQGLLYYTAVLLFHAYPLPRGGGFSATLAYTGELADAGFCPLIYPEGRMRRLGESEPPHFLDGTAVVAAELRLPIVPVGLVGVGRALHAETYIPRPGRITVRFGEPIRLPGGVTPIDPTDLTRRMEEAVRSLVGRA